MIGLWWECAILLTWMSSTYVNRVVGRRDAGVPLLVRRAGSAFTFAIATIAGQSVVSVGKKKQDEKK